jgi:large subunit ribosomal protein L29
MLTASDIRDLSVQEIEKRIEEETEEYEELRFRHTIQGRIENPMLLRTKRREIARLKTILNEKTRDDEAHAP